MLGVGPQPLYCPWPRFFGYPPGRGLRIAPPALRGTSGSATMTTPGGAGTTHPPVLGAPASLLGSELLAQLASDPSLCPVPVPQGRLMYTRATSLPNPYIRNIIPDNVSIPLLGYRALLGRGYAGLFYVVG